ncbi:MAG: hypothetical protein QXL76_00450 [Candidatus Rehaiarchaeum fermentans]|nr:hypothetical protein [Candidatus Rehaiarchaeum fermentans]
MKVEKDIENLINMATEDYLRGGTLYYTYSKIAKRTAIHNNIHLSKYRLLCRKCGNLLVGNNVQIRFKNKFKIIKCIKCKNVRKIYVKAE